MKALSDPTHPINLANKEFGCSGYPICSLVCFFIGKANYNILLVIEFEFEFEFTNSFLLFYSNMMIKRPSTLCDAQSINRSANPNDNKWCTVMHFRLWPNGHGREFLASASRFDPLCARLSPPRCLTCLLGLQGVQWV